MLAGHSGFGPGREGVHGAGRQFGHDDAHVLARSASADAALERTFDDPVVAINGCQPI